MMARGRVDYRRNAGDMIGMQVAVGRLDEGGLRLDFGWQDCGKPDYAAGSRTI